MLGGAIISGGLEIPSIYVPIGLIKHPDKITACIISLESWEMPPNHYLSNLTSVPDHHCHRNRFALREAQLCNASQNKDDESKNHGCIKTFPNYGQGISIS